MTQDPKARQAPPSGCRVRCAGLAGTVRRTVQVARHADLLVGVGITERAARSILRDLEDAGYLSRTKLGRRNRYEVHPDGPLRHPEESTTAVSDLLAIFRA